MNVCHIFYCIYLSLSLSLTLERSGYFYSPFCSGWGGSWFDTTRTSVIYRFSKSCWQWKDTVKTIWKHILLTSVNNFLNICRKQFLFAYTGGSFVRWTFFVDVHFWLRSRTQKKSKTLIDTELLDNQLLR